MNCSGSHDDRERWLPLECVFEGRKLRWTVSGKQRIWNYRLLCVGLIASVLSSGMFSSLCVVCCLCVCVGGVCAHACVCLFHGDYPTHYWLLHFMWLCHAQRLLISRLVTWYATLFIYFQETTKIRKLHGEIQISMFFWKTGSPAHNDRHGCWWRKWARAVTSSLWADFSGGGGAHQLGFVWSSITHPHQSSQPLPSWRPWLLLMNCDKSLLVSSDTFKSRNFHVPAAGINSGPSYHNDGVKAGVRRVHRRTGVEERLGGGVTRAGHLQHLSPGRMSCCLFNFFKVKYDPWLIYIPSSRLFICTVLCLLENYESPLLWMRRVAWTWHFCGAKHKGGIHYVFVWLSY